ncbi:MAG: hypothetical protein EB829_02750 [Nitrosopumilus sp. H8]|nr:MAG: hypothetical protein EB829_02750 [Nitrosopumilus sp. H8]
MGKYEVRVLCADGFCDSVMEYMKSNGYERVTRKTMAGADHYGILESADLDTAVVKAREIKRDLKDKVIILKMISPP